MLQIIQSQLPFKDLSCYVVNYCYQICLYLLSQVYDKDNAFSKTM